MLVKRFKDSHFQYDIESNNSRLISNPSGLIISRSRYGASYLTQIGLLSHRGFVNSYRNPGILFNLSSQWITQIFCLIYLCFVMCAAVFGVRLGKIYFLHWIFLAWRNNYWLWKRTLLWSLSYAWLGLLGSWISRKTNSRQNILLVLLGCISLVIFFFNAYDLLWISFVNYSFMSVAVIPACKNFRLWFFNVKK